MCLVFLGPLSLQQRQFSILSHSKVIYPRQLFPVHCNVLFLTEYIDGGGRGYTDTLQTHQSAEHIHQFILVVRTMKKYSFSYLILKLLLNFVSQWPVADLSSMRALLTAASVSSV